MKNPDTQNSLKIAIKGIGTLDLGEASEIIIDRLVKDGEKAIGLFIEASDNAKRHKSLRHTTSVETLGYIINNRTLRCSSLTHANLNDQKEKERVNIEKFAPSRFISCFSHITHESVPFWGLYGDSKNKHWNVQLVFKNFANSLADVVHTDYCFLDGGKRAFFESSDGNCILSAPIKLLCETTGIPLTKADFDTRSWVANIELIDVEYLPVDDEAFSTDYSGQAKVHFGPDESYPSIVSTQYRPYNLGRQKTITWDTEKESRILCRLHMQDFNKWSFIDLRLKDEIFRDLVIVTNPWAEPSFKEKVRNLVANSPLSDNIKASISIQNSTEEGKINLR